MSKFKVGDKVQILDTDRLRDWGKWERIVGKTFTLTKEDAINLNTNRVFFPNNNEYGINIYLGMLKKLGGSMNQYKDLKTRIGALDDGWNKDADGILQEIDIEGDYRLVIPCSKNNSCWMIFITTKQNIRDTQAHFEYNTQCEKLEAFKKALLWLLDHSDIKKVDNKKEDKLTNLLSRAKAQVESIEEELEELRR